ncbi:hypothetical protein B1209_08280 [Raoultella planticola]|uniref:glycosyltransferase family 4 protein n=1 Tax=Raoultella planticola TaxID=575 RepID=UPI0005377D7A|nr:glycosyltransferase family 4 protein [Raoultella planticola]AUU07083.1 glycosyltransferase family 1 protein [Raoultella planticola]AUV52822.1 hypothetical protein B1209_08280 [Raoultella planticola]PNK80071.1 glycosyltransferase family 1 protein [Raoultella planticola]HDG9791026.1 glycosyltransferase family 4 protein [Raoultella planticola]HDH7773056.1 glycosyltransferase family 4 protein [Raoultella planticola]
MTKKKVLHVAETARGGVATVIRQLLKNDDVDSYCLLPDTHCKDVMEVPDLSIYTFKRKKRGMLSLINLSIQYLKLLKKIDPDIIHIHSSFAGVVCRLINILVKKKDIKVVYCPHAFAFIMDVKGSMNKVFLFIEKMLQPYANIIICTSKYEKKSAIKFGLKEYNLEVVYNGVEDPQDVSDASSPYQSNFTNILFVGRFDHQKGFDLVEKLSHLVKDNTKITVIGDAVRDSAKKKEDGISSIIYKNWMSTTEIAPFFYYADFLFMPSRWESFGLVAVEAQSYGLPVVASNCSSLPEVVIDDITGYLFKKDDITEAWDIISSVEKSEWGLKKENCLKNYKSNFTTMKMIENINLVYKSLF